MFPILFLSLLAVADSTLTSCQDVKDAGTNVDGTYTVTLGGVSVEIFCYMMGASVTVDGAPFAYITLPPGNTAQWEFGNITTTTTFHKVRLNESSLRIYTGDCTYILF